MKITLENRNKVFQPGQTLSLKRGRKHNPYEILKDPVAFLAKHPEIKVDPKVLEAAARSEASYYEECLRNSPGHKLPTMERLETVVQDSLHRMHPVYYKVETSEFPIGRLGADLNLCSQEEDLVKGSELVSEKTPESRSRSVARVERGRTLQEGSSARSKSREPVAARGRTSQEGSSVRSKSKTPLEPVVQPSRDVCPVFHAPPAAEKPRIAPAKALSQARIVSRRHFIDF